MHKIILVYCGYLCCECVYPHKVCSKGLQICIWVIGFEGAQGYGAAQKLPAAIHLMQACVAGNFEWSGCEVGVVFSSKELANKIRFCC